MRPGPDIHALIIACFCAGLFVGVLLTFALT
jgi:hypothetical protein